MPGILKLFAATNANWVEDYFGFFQTCPPRSIGGTSGRDWTAWSTHRRPSALRVRADCKAELNRATIASSFICWMLRRLYKIGGAVPRFFG